LPERPHSETRGDDSNDGKREPAEFAVGHNGFGVGPLVSSLGLSPADLNPSSSSVRLISSSTRFVSAGFGGCQLCTFGGGGRDGMDER
jgi:hypothetical protein